MKIDYNGKEFTVACNKTPFDEEDLVQVKLRLVEFDDSESARCNVATSVLSLSGVLLRINPEHLPTVGYGCKYPVINVGDLRKINSDIDIEQMKQFGDDQFKRGMSEAYLLLDQMTDVCSEDRFVIEKLKKILSEKINEE